MKQIISFKKEVAFKTMIGEITNISLEHTLQFIDDSNIEGDLVINGTYKMTEASTLEETFHYSLPVDIMLTSQLDEADRSIAIDNFTYQIINEEVLELNIDILVKGLEKIEEIEDPEEIEVIEEEHSIQIEETLEEQPEEIKEEENIRNDDQSIKDSSIENDVTEEVFKSDVSTSSLSSQEDIASQQEVMNQLSSTTEIPVNSVSEELPSQPVNASTVEISNDAAPVMNSIFSAFANTEETYTTYSVYIFRQEDTLEDILNKYGVSREELSYYNELDNITIGSKLIIPTSKVNA